METYLAEKQSNMNISTIGRTSENRDIKLVTVNGDRGLPKIFIDAGIHARYRSTTGSYPPRKMVIVARNGQGCMGLLVAK